MAWNGCKQHDLGLSKYPCTCTVAANVCQSPPPGWKCTRPTPHDGPCAAIEVVERLAYDALAVVARTERNHKAATPGPWTIGEDVTEDAATVRATPVMATTGRAEDHPVDVIIPFGRAFSDARFVVDIHTDAPLLIKAFRELHRQVAILFADRNDAVARAEKAEARLAEADK